MPLIDIHHVALKTRDLDASLQFYVDLLGMRKVDRPNFDFPGAWLQMGDTMFHLMAGYAAEGPNGELYHGSGSVDHLALNANDFDGMRAVCETKSIGYRENDLSDFGIWQLFVDDPDGVVVEMNFKKADEPAGAIGPRRQTLSKVG